MINLLIAAATIATADAPAAELDRLPDVTVYYGDLDLATTAGVQVLDRRMATAVEDACPSDYGVRDLSRTLLASQCRAEKQAAIAPLRAAALGRAAQLQPSDKRGP